MFDKGNLEEVGKKIDDFKKNNQQKKIKEDSNRESNSMSRKAMHAGIEFMSAVVAAIIIGVAIDYLLDTSPAAVIILFLLGVAAGIINIVRFAKELNEIDQKH